MLLRVMKEGAVWGTRRTKGKQVTQLEKIGNKFYFPSSGKNFSNSILIIFF